MTYALLIGLGIIAGFTIALIHELREERRRDAEVAAEDDGYWVDIHAQMLADEEDEDKWGWLKPERKKR